ncbi:MAG: putative transcriptional regulatory protein [Cellvibrio sp.]|nr:putative transcriptional regulatory protein [Cellvibrio sp.]
MTLEILPQALLSMKNVHPVLSDGNSLILFKQLNESLINKAIYLRQIIHDNDGVSNLVDENHLIFLTKGIYTVSDFVPAQGVFNAVLFSIDDKLIDKYLSSLIDGVRVGNQLPLNQVRGTYVIQANEQIRRYIHSLADVYSEFGQTPALVELKLLELLHLIARQDQSYRFVRELSSRVRNNKNHRSITDFMEQYYSHKLNVDDYALLTGRSVSTFLRDFKRIYNTTPNKWIVDKKVEVARGLMLTNNYSVTRAALEAGFEDVSNFIKVYKRKYGVTPKQSKSRIEQMQYENIVSI